jgi:hypothetical protein
VEGPFKPQREATGAAVPTMHALLPIVYSCMPCGICRNSKISIKRFTQHWGDRSLGAGELVVGSLRDEIEHIMSAEGLWKPQGEATDAVRAQREAVVSDGVPMSDKDGDDDEILGACILGVY